MKKITPFLLIFIFNLSIVIAQPEEYDNLLHKQNLNKSNLPLYLKKAQDIEVYNPDLALYIYKKASDTLSYYYSDITYSRYKAQILNNISNIDIYYKSEFDSAYKYALEALKLDSIIFSTSNEKEIINEARTGMGVSFLNIGKINECRGYFLPAIENYIKATKIFVDINDNKLIAKCYINIGSINDCIGDYRKAKEYYYKALSILNNYDISLDLGECLSDIGISHDEKENRDSAIIYYNKALCVYEKLGNSQGIAESYLNIAGDYIVYDDKIDEKKAIELCNKALKIFKTNKCKFYISETFSCISNLKNSLKQFDTAKTLAYTGLKIAEEINSLYLKCNPYQYLSIAYEGLGKNDSALKYFKLYKVVYDSLYAEDKNNECVDALVKESISSYDRELQNKKIEYQKQINYILICVIIFIIIFSIIIYKINKRNIENKNKIKIRDSLINGEEKERSRIGQELHDGVCSELSAVKMNLEILKSNSPTPEGFDKIISQLNEANESIRNISHNLNSFLLVKFGLFTAVSNLCEKIQDLNKVNLKLEITGINDHIEKSVGITVYRIIQELLNNIIKHSNAKEVKFKLNYSNNLLTIEIKDDGVGFDIKSEKAENGVGLNNIKNRVALLNGKLNVNSDINIGTTFKIEIPINEN